MVGGRDPEIFPTRFCSLWAGGRRGEGASSWKKKAGESEKKGNLFKAPFHVAGHAAKKIRKPKAEIQPMCTGRTAANSAIFWLRIARYVVDRKI